MSWMNGVSWLQKYSGDGLQSRFSTMLGSLGRLLKIDVVLVFDDQVSSCFGRELSPPLEKAHVVL